MTTPPVPKELAALKRELQLSHITADALLTAVQDLEEKQSKLETELREVKDERDVLRGENKELTGRFAILKGKMKGIAKEMNGLLRDPVPPVVRLLGDGTEYCMEGKPTASQTAKSTPSKKRVVGVVIESKSKASPALSSSSDVHLKHGTATSTATDPSQPLPRAGKLEGIEKRRTSGKRFLEQIEQDSELDARERSGGKKSKDKAIGHAHEMRGQSIPLPAGNIQWRPEVAAKRHVRLVILPGAGVNADMLPAFQQNSMPHVRAVASAISKNLVYFEPIPLSETISVGGADNGADMKEADELDKNVEMALSNESQADSLVELGESASSDEEM
ncbi:hypothetical protein L198_02091 [Cryptococcus wingfieldii CBS 7118]|uniref:Uncharacterized protein n=1 Tax=Cryptococcus wingfieldii CBS 7118 TaxID=1295528 RepID=A0A1E3JX05_9TREE|nr:hypothetical protein L198_02091 [Cryptococcus wingfieldii CBS 7118]ODO05398.1 hypothetical protein L198_02091 [Cryptococcus wingfieldii CBS 7118]